MTKLLLYLYRCLLIYYLSITRLYQVYFHSKVSSESFLSFMEKLSRDQLQNNKLKKADILMEGDRSIYDVVMMQSYNFYDRASLFGITLKSRGPNHREKVEAIEEKSNYGAQIRSYIPCNGFNQLSSCWYDKKGYSSWLKFHDKDAKLYAQANTFFRFKLPADKLLHGTAIASICTYNVNKKIQRDFNVNQICFSSKNNYDRYCRFVPLVNVYSTAVAILPMDKLYKPYNLYPVRATKENSQRFTDVRRENAEYLILIDLHPERFEVNADNGGLYDRYYRSFEPYR